ncbi:MULTISPECIES: dicarboxylate/amino acid:cation symporter [Enorma]|uniref:Dicarboxylate/amino acid:cation symporter n=1 Tax=[Collinsella] massiliensis TaxID=1232426 RepID=A0A1Y3XSU9_9ACTN|nr:MULTISPECIES: dicarboxylate/amino acid:cation symporter [Enorma]OUN88573.1 dicarboxylate/amino acid:cation symporter [[Collinsella] massiliensis]
MSNEGTLRTRKFTYNATLAIVIAMVAGYIVGAIGGKPLAQIQFIGDIFFRLVQMGIVPFVMCTIIEAVGGLTARDLSGIGLKGIAWFAGSSVLASACGVAAATIFQPGAGLAGTALVQEAAYDATGTTAVTVQDTLTNFFSSNIVSSMAAGAMVPCIVFSIALGLAISFWRTTHEGEPCPVLDVTKHLGELLLIVIRGVMTVAPIGIFCYVSSMVGQLGPEVLIPLLKYLLVLGGTVFAFLVLWIVVVCVRCALSPIVLIRHIWRMSFMAIATISSAVTLPVEMDDAKNKIGVRDDIADLVLPLGMPLNSNGASIHLAVTAITIAQIYGMSFGGFDFVYLTVISTLLSLANAVAPGADIVSLTMIVPQLGLPLSSIGIFAGLTYPVGAIRTILNVDSDVFCAMMVAAGEKDGIDRDVFYGKKALDA